MGALLLPFSSPVSPSPALPSPWRRDATLCLPCNALEQHLWGEKVHGLGRRVGRGERQAGRLPGLPGLGVLRRGHKNTVSKHNHQLPGSKQDDELPGSSQRAAQVDLTTLSRFVPFLGALTRRASLSTYRCVPVPLAGSYFDKHNCLVACLILLVRRSR